MRRFQLAETTKITALTAVTALVQERIQTLSEAVGLVAFLFVGDDDLVIEDASGAEVAASEVIAPGQSGTVEVSLQPGEYVFYCSIGNHREMGMEVAVTVS